MKKAAAIGGIAAGAGLLLAGVQRMSGKNKLKGGKVEVEAKKAKNVPDYVKPLINLVGEETIASISKDPAWTELCDRAADFYSLSVLEFKELCYAIADVVEFQMSLHQEKTKMNLGTPRLFRQKLHAVVEAVRNYRAGIELKCASALNDFDDVASDIQKAHDDAANNIFLESSLY